MRRFLKLQRQSPEPKRASARKTSRSRPRPDEPSPLSELPYEVVENILVFAWHSEATALPGGGRFAFDVPAGGQNPSFNGWLSLGPFTRERLLPNPHTKLTTSNEAVRDKDGYFPNTAEFGRLSLVCSQWAEIMRDVVLAYVPLTTLRKYNAYAQLVGVELPSIGSGEANDAKPDAAAKAAEEKARRLCQSIHVDVPTGNLSMVPSWSSIPPLLNRLDNLVHLMLTAAEPHPALFDVLASLPPAIRTLDIHISSPYLYSRPMLPHQMHVDSAALPGSQKLRTGLSNVRHLLINVLDPLVLECLLEGFGSCSENPQTNAGEGASRASKVIYSSPSLQTLIIQGPHDLTSSHVTNTVSHSHTIHTLKLYPHSITRNTLSTDPFKPWNAQEALSNEAWFPALELLVVQLPQFEESTPVLEEIREICKKRGMRVEVEWVPRVSA